MDKKLISALLTICSVLNKQGVDYLVVGGIAVALHGYFRRSIASNSVVSDKVDLDIWYNPTYSNYFKVLEALEELGQNITKHKDEQTPNPKKAFFRYVFEDFTLDLLPELRVEQPPGGGGAGRMPRIGSPTHPWQNGFYDALSIIIVFPGIIFLAASGAVRSAPAQRCRFLGAISCPIYLTHYPLIYPYPAWVATHQVPLRDG